jgi:hypothetical protein
MIAHSIATNFSHLITMFYGKPDKPEFLQDIRDLGLQQRPQELPKDWLVSGFLSDNMRSAKQGQRRSVVLDKVSRGSLHVILKYCLMMAYLQLQEFVSHNLTAMNNVFHM